MRGKPRPRRPYMTRFRITPAHAGKTDPGILSVRVLRDHPRACGENKMCPAPCLLHAGSPPRMRGKLLSNACGSLPARITPAHAGKTRGCAEFRQSGWDHPRACGENCVRLLVSLIQTGSPPRMRGKRINIHSSRLKPGITPAHAGKTAPPWI